MIPAEGKALINNALGADGYYGAFTIQVHSDDTTHAPARQELVEYAIAHGVPVVSELQLLKWLDGRNSSSFQNINYAADGRLSFTVSQGANANGLEAMLPAQGLSALTHNGQTVSPIPTQTIKGVTYAILPDASGSYVATYPPPPAGQGGPASTVTGTSSNGSGSGACEDAGDPGTNPGGGTTNPGGGTTNPGGGTTNPGGGTTNPGGGTTNPGGGTTNPGGATTNPGGGTTAGGTEANGGLTGTTATGGGTGNAANSGQTGTPGKTTTPRFLSTTASAFRPGSKRKFALTVRLNRDSRVVLTIRDSRGKIVRQIRVSRRRAGSVLHLSWDGKDAGGHYAAAGRE